MLEVCQKNLRTSIHFSQKVKVQPDQQSHRLLLLPITLCVYTEKNIPEVYIVAKNY